MKYHYTIAFSLNFLSLFAQSDTLPTKDIAPITITATRLNSDKNQVPLAVSVLDKSKLQSVQQQLSIHDALSTVTGVFVQNPDNFAQDLRISIRGFGARAAFGIRGIRIITDGIPESTPDGQADVDNIDAGALQRMEILRGASSALYGNAAGGVIYLQTEEPSDKPFGEMQVSMGSYGFQRYQGKTAFQTGKLGVFMSVGHNRTEGYRKQSAMRQTIANTKLIYTFSKKTKLKLLLNYGNSPQADDAGGLTVEQIATDRRQARPQNIQFNGGESVQQGRAGFVLEHKINEKSRLILRGFATARDFDNRLAFQSGGTVEINRVFGGGGAQYEFKDKLLNRPYRTQVGLDMDKQRDHRLRFNNDNGKKGAQTFDQNEKFGSIGAYWLNEWHFLEKLYLIVSTRYDKVNLAVEDKFLTDGDQSGSLPLTRFSPLAGLTFKISPRLFTYINANSNFEAPTLNELSANPSNTGGFNPDLKPQKAISYEWGIKAKVGEVLTLETALFQIDLTDEFVPYQLPQFVGRTFFRNAGKSKRNGVELGINYAILPELSFTANYTYSNFKYLNYTSGTLNYAGNRQPGIPQHTAYSELRWLSKRGISVLAQVRHASEIFANDANTVKNPAYTLVILRGGYRHNFKAFGIEPFGGVTNLFDVKYNANVLLNAAGNRYFEPAAGRYFYGGVKVYL